MDKEHRWRWLAAEFSIIVLGVLSALVVDTWIDEREDARRAAIYIERLVDDLESDTRDLRVVSDYYARIRRFGLIALDDLEGRRAVGDFALVFAAFNAAEEWGFRPQSSTFEDLRSTGSLALIDDVPLRLAIADYYRTAANRETVWALPRDFRAIARGIIPNALQAAIHAECTAIPDDIVNAGVTQRATGDMFPAMQDPDSITSPEPDFCGLDAAAFDVARAAEELRTDPTVARTLRFRISEMRVARALFDGQVAMGERLLARLGRP